jgi:hypothetical protein
MARGETGPPTGGDSVRLSRRKALVAAGVLGLQAPGLLSRAASAVDIEPTQGRTLVFDEPFHTIDPALWNAGPKATTFEPGYYGRSAFAPLEGEAGFNPYAIVDDPRAEDGKALQISAAYIGRPMSVHGYYGNANPEYQWVSGNLQTARRDGTIIRGWRQGYFEARMHMPRHPLTWPAFWLMNGRSILFPQTSIELDIVEHKGFEPRLYGAYLHEWGQPGEHHEGIGVPTRVDVTRGYHRYGMVVERDRCTLYFDRRLVRDPATGQPVVWRIGRAGELDQHNDVFWPLVTLALRNDVPFPNPLLPEHRLAHLRVDYVRVYA